MASPAARHFAARPVLLAHHLDDFRRRPDKRDLRGLANFREIGVLGKKPVARMNGVHVGDFRRADHLRNVQITFAAARRPDAHGFIRKAHVQRIAVGFAEYTATVEMPSSLQAQMTRRAISPRLATRIFWNMAVGCRLLLPAGPDAEQRLAVLHRLPVFDDRREHFAAGVRLDFVHQLHGFHDAERLPGFPRSRRLSRKPLRPGSARHKRSRQSAI